MLTRLNSKGVFLIFLLIFGLGFTFGYIVKKPIILVAIDLADKVLVKESILDFDEWTKK